MQEKPGERSQSRFGWLIKIFSVILAIDKSFFQENPDSLSHFQIDGRLKVQWE